MQLQCWASGKFPTKFLNLFPPEVNSQTIKILLGSTTARPILFTSMINLMFSIPCSFFCFTAPEQAEKAELELDSWGCLFFQTCPLFALQSQ